MRESSEDKWLLLIGVFKLLKAALLFAVGFGILKLLHKDVAEVLSHWIDVLRVDPDNRYVHGLLTKALSVDDRKLKEISVGTFCYAGLFLTEGTGLLLRKRWAQYFTIIVTSSLLPLEIYEMMRHVSVAKVLVLIINFAIVVYLVRNLQSSLDGGLRGG
jgi:uncharacterized membrane protein (DUF2068 family)